MSPKEPRDSALLLLDDEPESSPREPRHDSKRSIAQRLVDELAQAIRSLDDAEILLRDAHFPLKRVPPFTTPLAFWSKIVELASLGILRDGTRQLARSAANAFPGNRVFADCLIGEARADCKRGTWSLTLKVDNVSDDQLGEILDTISQMAGDPIVSLVRVDKGSVVLVLRMHDRSANTLADADAKGKLAKRLGLPTGGLREQLELGNVTDLRDGSEHLAGRMSLNDPFSNHLCIELHDDVLPGDLAQVWDRIPWNKMGQKGLLIDLERSLPLSEAARDLLEGLLRELASHDAVVALVFPSHMDGIRINSGQFSFSSAAGAREWLRLTSYVSRRIDLRCRELQRLVDSEPSGHVGVDSGWFMVSLAEDREFLSTEKGRALLDSVRKMNPLMVLKMLPPEIVKNLRSSDTHLDGLIDSSVDSLVRSRLREQRR